MGMPQIPEGTNRPSAEELLIDLLESIALEEMAISHILNAEGEKLQAVVASYKNEIADLCAVDKMTESIHTTISDLIIKEWLLLNKFNNIKDYAVYIDNTKKTKECLPKCNHECKCKKNECD